MTTIRVPAPATSAEARNMRDITVKDLIATLQTYPDDHIVFPVPIGRLDLGAELIVAVDEDTEGVSAYSIHKTEGVSLVDADDQPKTVLEGN